MDVLYYSLQSTNCYNPHTDTSADLSAAMEDAVKMIYVFHRLLETLSHERGTDHQQLLPYVILLWCLRMPSGWSAWHVSLMCLPD